MGSTPAGRAIYIRNVAQLGRALGLGPRGRRFESWYPSHFHSVLLAQLVEHLTFNQRVEGSSPSWLTI